MIAENNPTWAYPTWLYNEIDDAWECKSCGLYWQLSNDDTPKQNGINFCPKCGIKIGAFVWGWNF